MNWNSLGEIKLLVADDDAFNRQLIIALLARIPNIKIVEAANGIETLDILKREPIDMLLLDYHMPKMDGAQALNLIREEPKFNALPIIVITTDESERERFYGYGVNDYIMKPFEFEKIRNAIYKYLKNRNS